MTGTLRNSFLRNGWKKKSNTSIEAFSNDVKSRAHDEGYPEKNIPARPFMWLSNDAKEVMAQIILDKLAR
jgi:phage gpG-like protein